MLSVLAAAEAVPKRILDLMNVEGLTQRKRGQPPAGDLTPLPQPSVGMGTPGASVARCPRSVSRSKGLQQGLRSLTRTRPCTDLTAIAKLCRQPRLLGVGCRRSCNRCERYGCPSLTCPCVCGGAEVPAVPEAGAGRAPGQPGQQRRPAQHAPRPRVDPLQPRLGQPRTGPCIVGRVLFRAAGLSMCPPA